MITIVLKALHAPLLAADMIKEALTRRNLSLSQEADLDNGHVRSGCRVPPVGDGQLIYDRYPSLNFHFGDLDNGHLDQVASSHPSGS